MLTDAALIQELHESYSRQLTWYDQLGVLGEKLLGQIVLSRGNVSGIVPEFIKKKELLDKIITERGRTRQMVSEWQERKNVLGKTADAEKLDGLLEKLQNAISQFLESEEQVQRYLEHSLKKGTTA